MASSTWLVSLGCALAACGGGGGGGPDAGDDSPGDDVSDADDGAQSGSRLKLRWTDFAGTRVGGVDAHDTVIDATCAPVPWVDGTTRCTPATSEIAYRDAACTQPVGVTFADDICPGPAREFFASYAYTECGGGPDQVYRRGDPVTLTGYYGKTGGSTCSGPYMPDNRAFYTLGAEVPRDSLVTLALGPPAGTGRYHQRFWESADGARLFGLVSDDTLSTDCVLQHYREDSTATCIPASPGYAHHYSDSTCTTPVAQVGTACAAPDYLTYYPIAPATCPEDRRPHLYTVAGTTTELFQGLATCDPVTPEPGWTYHVAGDELERPALTVAVDAVPGRQLQLAHAVDGTSRVRLPYEQYDVANDTDCFIVDDPAGARCIPLRPGPIDYFTDAACTASIRLVEVFYPDASCDLPVAPAFATGYSTASCPGSYEIYRVGAMYSGPLYRALDDVTCIEELDPTRLRFVVGEQVPLSAFPAGMRVIDP